MQQQSRCIVPPYSICLLYSLHLYPSSPAAAASVLQLRSVALPTISSLVNVLVPFARTPSLCSIAGCRMHLDQSSISGQWGPIEG
jgi:hypothetical protein